TPRRIPCGAAPGRGRSGRGGSGRPPPGAASPPPASPAPTSPRPRPAVGRCWPGPAWSPRPAIASVPGSWPSGNPPRLVRPRRNPRPQPRQELVGQDRRRPARRGSRLVLDNGLAVCHSLLVVLGVRHHGREHVLAVELAQEALVCDVNRE